MEAYEKLEAMTEAMGTEKLLEELACALSYDDLSEALDWVARCWDC